jgi:hypothetical protein
MIATLCSYDRLFGPCHVQTLSLAAHIAEVLRDVGELQQARRLLERVIRDLAHSGGRARAKRISALHTLRDLMVEQSDIPGAVAVQTEIWECRRLLAGPGAPETTTAVPDLRELLMLSSESTLEN